MSEDPVKEAGKSLWPAAIAAMGNEAQRGKFWPMLQSATGELFSMKRGGRNMNSVEWLGLRQVTQYGDISDRTVPTGTHSPV